MGSDCSIYAKIKTGQIIYHNLDRSYVFGRYDNYETKEKQISLFEQSNDWISFKNILKKD